MLGNTEIGGIIRTIAAAAFGFLSGKGYIDGETATALAGAVAVIGTAIWSIVSKRKAA